jgi:putative transposase
MNAHSVPEARYAVSMRIRHLQHSVYQVQYQLVWGTKYRRKVLKYYACKELVHSLYTVPRRHPTWYFHSINTGDDHVHLLMEIPPS